MTNHEINIKQYLDENQIDIFLISDIQKVFSKNNSKEFKNALRKAIKLEYKKIERGKYCRNTFSDEYAIGNFLTPDATIAYWSALNIHGLTEQFPNKVYIQTKKRKKDTEIFGVNYQFIKLHQDKMIGIEKFGIGTNQFRITDIEKTIVDCFDMLDYSGGFMELIRAFNRTKLSAKKMIDYSIAVNNKAVIKRIGYLAELFNKKGFKQFISFAKKQKSKNYDLFDIYGLNEGKHNADWRLRLNMTNEELTEIANSIY